MFSIYTTIAGRFFPLSIFDPRLVESADMEPTDTEPTDTKGQLYVSNLTMSSPNCVTLDTSKTTFKPQTMSPIPT